MNEDNGLNVYYFENISMRELFNDMNLWQKENRKRFLSTSIQQDGGKYCCISLTNPTEVTIVGPDGNRAQVNSMGQLLTNDF